MGKTAFLFSGQGAQYPGMGKDLYERSGKVRAIYQLASDILGYDAAALSFEGEAAELSRTAVAQPLIFTLSMAVYETLREETGDPDCVAGHSLGEYAAMTAAGVFTLEDGLRVIKARGKAMQEAAEAADGAMYAIVGSDSEAIEAACRQAGGFVVPVNYNSPVQTVIAGESAAAAEAARLLAEKGAKTVKLAVNSAFHCKMMAGAAEQLVKDIQGIPFSKPRIPFYSNLDGKPCEEITPAYLASHLVSPVRFVDELNAMSRDGVTCFIEAGPGRVLTGLVKKTVKGAAAANAEDGKTLEKALKLCRGEAS